MKRVVVAPFELKICANESYVRAASVKPTPGAQKAQIRTKITVKLQGSAAWAQPLKWGSRKYPVIVFQIRINTLPR